MCEAKCNNRRRALHPSTTRDITIRKKNGLKEVKNKTFKCCLITNGSKIKEKKLFYVVGYSSKCKGRNKKDSLKSV